MKKTQSMYIQGKFHSIMKLAQALDKLPKKFGTDELLSNSEIHLIEIIGDHQGLSVTDIGNLMGITKGAVSQGLKKLETKGYTFKNADPQNQSRTIVQITAKGKAAYWAHKDWHEQMDGGFSQYIQALEDKDLKVITEFLERTEDFLSRRIDSVK